MNELDYTEDEFRRNKLIMKTTDINLNYFHEVFGPIKTSDCDKCIHQIRKGYCEYEGKIINADCPCSWFLPKKAEQKEITNYISRIK